MGRRKTPALSENEKPLSFCLVYPLNFLFLSIKSVPIPLMWRDLHIACHGRRSWLVIFCWFWINSSLLEAYLAIYLPKVGRSIVWEDDQQRENRTPIWPFFLYWGSTSCQRKQWHPHSSTLAWQIPWTEEPGRLQSMESLRVGQDWAASLSHIGVGKGNPLQCSCLENPRDRGSWYAAVSGVAQSWTQLKRQQQQQQQLHFSWGFCANW